MADDLDRFVLQYTIDLKDSIARIEKLHTKMDGVQTKGKKAVGGLKEFASGAAGELNKLAPGVDAVSKAVGALGAEFAAAGAAVAILAVGVKSVLDLRTQFNQQRGLGQQMGMSPVRLEDYQRKLVGTGGGYVSRDSAAKGLEQLLGIKNAAYQDPTRTGKDALMLRRMGIDPAANLSAKDYLSGVGGWAASHSKEDVMGMARYLGVDPNVLMSIKQQGSTGMGNITNMTSAEIANRDKAQDSLDKFNDELERFKNNINQLEIALGENLLPAADKFLEWVSKLVGAFNHAVTATAPNDPSKKFIVGPGHTLTPNPNYVDPNPPAPTYKQGRYEIRNGHRVNLPDLVAPVDQKKESEEQAAKKAAAAAAEQQKRNALANADEEKTGNAQGVAGGNQLMLAANLFASAVGQFSNAVDMQQAWAAWAGEIGKASGIPGSSNASISGTNGAGGGSRGLRNNNPGNLEYGDFAKAHGATGSDGRFAIFPSMDAGVAAHNKLIEDRYLSKGLSTPRKIIAKYAPANENNQGAYLKFLESQGFAPDSVIKPSEAAAFNAAQLRYESGYGSGKGIGESKNKMGMRMVQQSIADYLGVPVQQVATGRVMAGDAGWAMSSVYNGAVISKSKLQQQVAAGIQPGMTPAAFGKLQMQLREQARGIEMMKQYGADVVAQQRPGGQQWTQGQINPTININISGVTDPHAVAAEVQKQLNKGMSDILNHFADGVKG